MNFTAGKARKDTVYYWDFGNGETFYGVNPASHKFPLGKYTVTLKIFDTKTGNIREEYFSVIVQKLVSMKKAKTPKIIPTKAEKSLVIREQDYFAPQKLA